MEHSAFAVPFPFTKFLFLLVLFSFFLHSSPTSLISQALQFRPFFPYLAKGRMTRIKLVLARPIGFVLSTQWQVTEMKWTINLLPNLAGDATVFHFVFINTISSVACICSQAPSLILIQMIQI